MTRWRIREDSGAEEIIDAASLDEALEAARDWAAEGSYDERVMVEVRVQEIDAGGAGIGDVHYTEVEAGPEPEEPECASVDDHDWQTPYHLVGGCRENPGVWGGAGTSMSFRSVCRRCGTYRLRRITGSQRNPGEVPETVTYEDADDASRRWVESERDE